MLSENMVRMLGILDKVADDVDQDSIAQFIGKSIADLDPILIRQILTQKIQDLFGGNLYQYIVSQIDDAKYEAVTRQIHPGDGGPADGGEAGTSAMGGTDKAYGRRTDAGKDATRRSQLQSDQGEQGVQKEIQARLLEKQVQQILNTGEDEFPDPQMMASCPM